MCKLIRKTAEQLVEGQKIATEDFTLWGWRNGLHTIVEPHCELDTRLVKFEVRDGPSLVYLIRAEPQAQYEICT